MTRTAILLLGLLAPVLRAAELPVDFQLPEPPGAFVSAPPAETAFRQGQPLVATTYFYWYDNATNAHVVNHDGADALTDHPKTLDGFSYKSVDWHAGELADMIAAGIDAALPVYWGEPTQVAQWSNEGLPPLVAARERLLKQGKRPPAIGMFYDTSTLRHNARRVHIDLTTPQGQRWFYGTIRDFFSLLPPEHRATIDGRPLVFLYASAFAKAVDQRLFPAVRAMFRKEFGSDLFLVKMHGWPGEAESQYQWGAALKPQLLDTAGVGPGYDHSAVPGRAPLVRSRDEGRFYRFGWQKLLDRAPGERPWLVHVETWNELHEGTEICETKEYGRQYIDLTRRFADVFHARGRLDPADRIDQLDSVSASPEKSQGLRLHISPDGDGLAKVIDLAGEKCWQTQPNRHSESRYLYFDADCTFLDDGLQPVRVTVEYRDAGPDRFVLEYDSADPAAAGIAQRFRHAGVQKIGGKNNWQKATFDLPYARFAGRANGADFRLSCGGAELTIRRVTVERIGQAAAETIDEATARIAADIEQLASDAMQGRGIGTEGLDRAADFLAERFAKLGLRTDLAGGGPFQVFMSSAPVPKTRQGVDWKTIDQTTGGPAAKIAEKSPQSERRRPAEAQPGPARQPVEGKNVVAMLAGEGPRADEVIVVGAHYDHLGMRFKGEQPVVFNGANDNASGTAALLEVARILSQPEKRLPRSVLFIAFSAEERGLVGSFYYVKHPLLPLDKTVAMVNLDMVGCIEGNAVMAAGSATSKLLTKSVGRVADEHGLNLIELPGNIGGSDHIPFYTHEVPVVHWMTTGGRLHYHRPSDDLETLDCGGIARIAAMAADLVVELAETEERPEHRDSGWGGTIIRNVIRLLGSAASAMAEPPQ